jgi:N,N'-diacetyllegionaminate synthase
MDRCEIIAEVGINHIGNMRLAHSMITAAKFHGADTVKFQLYDPEKLLDVEDFNRDDWQAILDSELSFGQIKEMKEWCDRLGVGFLCSAFDLERLRWLEELEVERHKIASRMIYDVEYCEAVMDTGKPYIVSTGWLNEDNSLRESIYSTYRRLRTESKQCILLYCVSDYPTKLENIKFTEKDFGYEYNYDGFSDHTIGTSAAITAIVYGAKIIEKHFTLDRSLKGPDQVCSMLPEELKQIVKFRDDFVKMGG